MVLIEISKLPSLYNISKGRDNKLSHNYEKKIIYYYTPSFFFETKNFTFFKHSNFWIIIISGKYTFIIYNHDNSLLI